MEILIGILIGALMTIALTIVFWTICVMCNFKAKQWNFYPQLLLYSLLIAVISFICIILIKA